MVEKTPICTKPENSQFNDRTKGIAHSSDVRYVIYIEIL